MHKNTFLPFAYAVGFILTVVGAWLKIVKEAGADLWLGIGVALSLAAIVMAMYEVLSSHRINRTEKVLWTLGLVLMSGIMTLFYLLMGRRKVVAG